MQWRRLLGGSHGYMGCSNLRIFCEYCTCRIFRFHLCRQHFSVISFHRSLSSFWICFAGTSAKIAGENRSQTFERSWLKSVNREKPTRKILGKSSKKRRNHEAKPNKRRHKSKTKQNRTKPCYTSKQRLTTLPKAHHPKKICVQTTSTHRINHERSLHGRAVAPQRGLRRSSANSR